jgi:NAD(P)H-binding
MVIALAGVFSVQHPPVPNGLKYEVRPGRKLIGAAKAMGVHRFVHISVARAGEQTQFINWDKGRWWAPYRDSKSAVNCSLRAGGFAHWTILERASMMDNLIPPKVHAFHPGLVARGAVEHAMAADTRLDLIAAADIGRIALESFADWALGHKDRFEIGGLRKEV